MITYTGTNWFLLL